MASTAPPPVDYSTAFAGLLEMEQELRALVAGHGALGERHERGALASLADRIEDLAKLYALTLRLLADPPVV